VIGLAAFALTARALGPTGYGVLALLHAYTRAIERFVSFQSWQPMIKYGAELQEQGRKEDLKSLLKLGFLLDLAAAAVAWVLALAGAALAASWFGWNDGTLTLLILYCTVLLFSPTGTSTAVLRLSGRFRAMAFGGVGNATLRLALCAVGVALGGEILFFALVWMGVQAVGSLTLLVLALRELHRMRLLRGLLHAPVRDASRRFPGLWGFAWSANLSLTIRASANEFDTLIVGALAGSAGAGLYHIAKRVGRLAQQVGVQVQSVVYPDVARLWAAGALKDFKRAVLQVELLLAAFAAASFLFFAIAAEPFLHWTAGPAFRGAAPLLTVQMLAAGLALAGSAVRSALLAMGLQRQVLLTVLVAIGTFHATALTLVPWIGPMGANFAHVALSAVSFVGMTLAFRRGLAHARLGETPAAAPQRALPVSGPLEAEA
jgi:O-antigen/teichoic acid export membrane protein